MTAKKSPKNRGGIKIEPLNGRFFDIKPAAAGQGPPKIGRKSEYLRFALVALTAFLILGLGNAYVLGRDLVWESQEAAYAGYESLKIGMDSLLAQDIPTASQYFLQAESAFYELSQTTRHLTAQANHLLAESLYLDTADKLIQGALEVSQIGQQLAQLMQDFAELPQAAMSVAGGEDGQLIEALLKRKAAFDEILALAASLQRKITTLNERVLPTALQTKLVSARRQIGQLMAALLDVDRNFDVLLRLLGDEVPHRYLILLQNNHELRATGGFIGSYLIVEINDGVISKMEAKDVYESDGQLRHYVKAPSGIDQVATQLYMRDANYSPDFPSAANEIRWFLEHSKGPSIDTVIAIDQTVVENLLTLTGPLVLPSFPLQISAQNFSEVVSFYTEAKLSETATPKQLLFDLIPAFRKEFAKLGNLSKLSETFLKLIERGHIQAHSLDPKIQQLIARFNVDGAMVRAGEGTDYLSVITTAIGGNKSDQYIKTDLHHQTFVGQKGQLENHLSIKKTHTWNREDESKLENLMERYGTGKLSKESLYFILGRGPNLDYMRVYVPKGSQLQDVSGIDISQIEVSQDQGYTVFGFTYGPVNAGESKELSLRYILPYRLRLQAVGSYEFIAQRQAGTENVTLKKEISLADSLIIVDSYPPSEGAFTLTQNPVLATQLDGNQIFMSAISLKP